MKYIIGISFGKWYSAAGTHFIRKRIFINGYRWTPFVKISRRVIFEKPEGQPNEPTVQSS